MLHIYCYPLHWHKGPRFHFGGHTGTAFTLNHQVQDALPPAGYMKRSQSARWLLPYMMRYWTHSYRVLTLRQATTKAHTIREEAAPYYEWRSHRDRALTLRQATTKAQTILEEAASFYEYWLLPTGIGRTSLRQATTRVHTIHEVAAPQHYMGVDPRGRACVEI